MLADVATYARFVRPARRLAEAQRSAPTWMYRSDGVDLTDNGGLGSCHAAEIPFVFGTTGRPELRLLIGPNPRSDVARTMHSTWAQFAATGDPGWAAGKTTYLADGVRTSRC